MPRNTSSQAVKRAQQARKSPSAAEELAWKYLRGQRLGFKFRREHPILNYRLDFYCPEAKLGVEFDGEQHSALADKHRDDHLAQFGIVIHRISNRALFLLDDGPMVDTFNEIRKICEERTGRRGIPFEL